MRLCSVVWLAPFLAAQAAGQRTWLVDWQGTGQFTDIPPAVAAAAAGDTILVARGGYNGATTDKGVRILSLTPNTGPYGVTGCHDLPLGEAFVLDSFGGATYTQIELRRNRGVVYIGPYEQHSSNTPTTRLPKVTVEDCDHVVFHRCFLYDVTVKNSTVLFHDCVIVGMPYPPPIGRTASPGLTAIDSDIRIVRPVVDGALIAHTWSSAPPPPVGIEMRGGRLVLAGRNPQCSWLDGGAALDLNGRWLEGAAIHSDGGEVILDPLIWLNPTNSSVPPLTGTSTYTFRDTSFVMTQHAVQGGKFTPEVFGPATAAFALFVSLDARPVPTPFGDLWLDPATILPVGGGSLGNGSVPFDVPVGNGVFPPGSAFSFQALLLDRGTLSLSQPCVARINALSGVWRPWSWCK